MTITYNGGDYIKIVDNGLFCKTYKIQGIKIGSYAGEKVYIIHKNGDYIQPGDLYILDDKQLLCDKRIQRVYIKKDEYYIQLEN